MRAMVTVCFVATCVCTAGVAAGGEPVTRGAPAVAPLPAWYAPLFELGRGWVFELGIHADSGVDDEEEGEPVFTWTQYRRSCSVRRVVPLGDARWSEVICTSAAKPGGPAPPAQIEDDGTINLSEKVPPAGFYLATPRGLWILEEAPASAADLPRLTQKQPVLEATPATGRHVYADLEEFGKIWRAVEEKAVAVPGGRSAKAWCVDIRCDDCPDPTFETYCFVPGMGPVSVAFQVGCAANDPDGKVTLLETTPPPAR